MQVTQFTAGLDIGFAIERAVGAGNGTVERRLTGPCLVGHGESAARHACSRANSSAHPARALIGYETPGSLRTVDDEAWASGFSDPQGVR
jgi:hypothetical protein